MTNKENKKLKTVNTMVINSINSSVMNRKIINNQEHFIIEAIILKEGVLNKIFYPDFIINKTAQSWNGRPIFINHPKVRDEPVSGNHPDMYDNNVGHVFNVEFTHDKKLKCEMYLNVQKFVDTGNSKLLNMITDGEQINVSTGLRAVLDSTGGTYGSVEYEATIEDITMADHLAILPDENGACSIADGCGTNIVNCQCEKCIDLVKKKKSEEVEKHGKDFTFKEKNVKIDNGINNFSNNMADKKDKITTNGAEVEENNIEEDKQVEDNQVEDNQVDYAKDEEKTESAESVNNSDLLTLKVTRSEMQNIKDLLNRENDRNESMKRAILANSDIITPEMLNNLSRDQIETTYNKVVNVNNKYVGANGVLSFSDLNNSKEEKGHKYYDYFQMTEEDEANILKGKV
ncbi:hypothetical protein AB832_07190 [Flavobacteriaceae bacterium (ex Bugula neritina AB1)]|nr:hypothetical protein AB832_07190 [Flavobacteriaceae bacterium (ex Bugula neritina AB1)]